VTVSNAPSHPSTNKCSQSHFNSHNSSLLAGMQLIFVTTLGETFAVEIDPNLVLQDVKALLEAEVQHTFLLKSSSSTDDRHSLTFQWPSRVSALRVVN
jgi:hypothetical protein